MSDVAKPTSSSAYHPLILRSVFLPSSTLCLFNLAFGQKCCNMALVAIVVDSLLLTSGFNNSVLVLTGFSALRLFSCYLKIMNKEID